MMNSDASRILPLNKFSIEELKENKLENYLEMVQTLEKLNSLYKDAIEREKDKETNQKILNNLNQKINSTEFKITETKEKIRSYQSFWTNVASMWKSNKNEITELNEKQNIFETELQGLKSLLAEQQKIANTLEDPKNKLVSAFKETDNIIVQEDVDSILKSISKLQNTDKLRNLENDFKNLVHQYNRIADFCGRKNKLSIRFSDEELIINGLKEYVDLKNINNSINSQKEWLLNSLNKKNTELENIDAEIKKLSTLGKISGMSEAQTSQLVEELKENKKALNAEIAELINKDSALSDFDDQPHELIKAKQKIEAELLTFNETINTLDDSKSNGSNLFKDKVQNLKDDFEKLVGSNTKFIKNNDKGKSTVTNDMNSIGSELNSILSNNSFTRSKSIESKKLPFRSTSKSNHPQGHSR